MNACDSFIVELISVLQLVTFLVILYSLASAVEPKD